MNPEEGVGELWDQVHDVSNMPMAVDFNSTIATLMTASEMYNVGFMTNSELREVFVDLLGQLPLCDYFWEAGYIMD